MEFVHNTKYISLFCLNNIQKQKEQKQYYFLYLYKYYNSYFLIYIHSYFFIFYIFIYILSEPGTPGLGTPEIFCSNTKDDVVRTPVACCSNTWNMARCASSETPPALRQLLIHRTTYWGCSN